MSTVRVQEAAPRGVFSLIAGWWGLPWDFLMTPVQLVRNVAVMLSPRDPSRTSADLERHVRSMIAEQALHAEKAEEEGRSPAPTRHVGRPTAVRAGGVRSVRLERRAERLLELVLTYDMRAPDFGALSTDLYAAALDQASWADELGFDLIGLGEHHASPDGYNPSPLVLAAAMGARTRRVHLRTSVLLAPLYDPVKLAEDAAVTQLATGGRLLLGIGGGYRPAEFELFDKKLEDRWDAVGETIAFLRLAWTGEPFEWRGRRCHVTPKPEPAPPILLGGSSPAAARRAARIADGWFPPLEPRLWPPYREACIELGKPDPGPYPAHGPIFVWVTEDVDAAWTRLMPHALHQLRSYATWTAESFGRPAGPYARGVSEATVRDGGAYRVVTPEQAIELAQSLGPDGVFHLNPLLAGIDPAFSWEMLRLYERAVHPHVSGQGRRATPHTHVSGEERR